MTKLLAYWYQLLSVYAVHIGVAFAIIQSVLVAMATGQTFVAVPGRGRVWELQQPSAKAKHRSLM